MSLFEREVNLEKRMAGSGSFNGNQRLNPDNTTGDKKDHRSNLTLMDKELRTNQKEDEIKMKEFTFNQYQQQQNDIIKAKIIELESEKREITDFQARLEEKDNEYNAKLD